jgi:periplasmic mercuric ion binding protein
MRSMAYVIAALAAVGIMAGIAMLPSATTDNPQAVQNASAVSTSESVMSEPGTLVMRVPDMHCPFACYPAVKSTLEGTEAVESVELTEQKQEGAIDNPEIVVKYQAGFDVQAAIAALEKKGFAKSEIVQ